jgi:hypothetical protein
MALRILLTGYADKEAPYAPSIKKWDFTSTSKRPGDNDALLIGVEAALKRVPLLQDLEKRFRSFSPRSQPEVPRIN